MQIGPQVDSVTLAAHTEFQQMTHDEFLQDLSSAARAIAYTIPSQWNQSFLSATMFGVGEDKCTGRRFEPTTRGTPCWFTFPDSPAVRCTAFVSPTETLRISELQAARSVLAFFANLT
jgi:hypothetical protein